MLQVILHSYSAIVVVVKTVCRLFHVSCLFGKIIMVLRSSAIVRLVVHCLLEVNRLLIMFESRCVMRLVNASCHVLLSFSVGFTEMTIHLMTVSMASYFVMRQLRIVSLMLLKIGIVFLITQVLVITGKSIWSINSMLSILILMQEVKPVLLIIVISFVLGLLVALVDSIGSPIRSFFVDLDLHSLFACLGICHEEVLVLTLVFLWLRRLSWWCWFGR